ncbi:MULTISPECIES: CPBP family intramembrane glutamic endopeptidase [unclassified Facklamia]|uniref:CPBP family intramembrane glutamic endopeptidase n=1 Tax=Aerococcaceae TaxID=186827 RepID=UPI0013B5CED5|nr:MULTISPECIES: CPBP family intramembrane glutamic endopeptidase [unclassified Facklamia]NEW65370.1 CPBP family intramembrane metalloprotease [Facklamia sp. 252]NEW68522.1 CPBP family intramembrane metalloprotease [Facklamia sp. 253]QQD64895.1 CPBP family intramembrane metalloprotease [Aerococcaceae bacterium zg-252]
MKKYANIIMFLAYGIMMIISGHLIDVIGDTNAVLLNSVSTLALGIYLFHDHLKAEYHRIRQRITIPKLFLLSVGLFFLSGIVRLLLVYGLSEFINFDTLGQNQQELAEMQQNIPFVLFFFLTVISAPIVEELVFRHSLNGWVNPNNRVLQIVMYAVSTYLFAAAHVFALQDFIIYLPLSLVLIWMYARFDNNVMASLAFHFTNNAIATVVTLLSSLIPVEQLGEPVSTILHLFVK